MKHHLHPSRRTNAFTLVELMVVVGVIGILAVSIAPAFTQLAASRAAAAVRDVERVLTLARTRAMSTGEPTGVLVDATAGSLQLMCIAGPGRSATVSPDASGASAPVLAVSSAYPGVILSSFINGDGGTSGTIWFAYDGTPHTRTSSGVIVGNFAQDASIVVEIYTVYVRRNSGLVERTP